MEKMRWSIGLDMGGLSFHLLKSDFQSNADPLSSTTCYATMFARQTDRGLGLQNGRAKRAKNGDIRSDDVRGKYGVWMARASAKDRLAGLISAIRREPADWACVTVNMPDARTCHSAISPPQCYPVNFTA